MDQLIEMMCDVVVVVFCFGSLRTLKTAQNVQLANGNVNSIDVH